MTANQPVVDPDSPETITVDWLEHIHGEEEPREYPAWGWLVRITTIICLGIIVYLTLTTGLSYGDPMVVYSTIMPLHTLIVFIVAWFVFKTNLRGSTKGDLASVIIPIYNQKELIETVVDAIYNSTYKNLEVIAVDDGSRDGTGEILEALRSKYPELIVIRKPNGGKRTAVAQGFYKSKGKYIILIDSDSVVEKNAIERLIMAFEENPKAGGVVGNGRVWNAHKNLLTRLQSAWYDYSFNIHKKCESTFRAVLCCSGCLAGYRRESIEDYIPYWAASGVQYSDDRALTTYTVAEPWVKKDLTSLPLKLMESMSQYDDADDRGLTAQTLFTWETIYVPTAIVYTDAPETLKKYLKQQIRWKKGYLRSNFFVSAFMWKKNPLMALIFYLEFMAAFTSPLILITVYLNAPLRLHDTLLPSTYLVGQVMIGLAAGLDFKARESWTKDWKYNMLMNIFLSLFLVWLIFPALWTIREKKWLTR